MSSGLGDLVFDPNGTATDSAGAIVGPLPVMLDRKIGKGATAGTLGVVVPGVYSPSEADDINAVATIPALQDDFSGGGLYSKRLIANGYTLMAPGFARAARVVTPPGKQTSVTLPSPSPALGSITGGFNHPGNGHLYFLAGRYALRVPNGTGTPVVDQDFGVGFVADGAAIFNGKVYVGGSGGNIWRCDASGTWTQSSNVSHRKAAVVTWLIPSEGTMLPRLVMANSALTGIRYTGADPMLLANWTPNPGSIAMGDSSYQISEIIGAPSHVYFPKTDGLYDLNSRGETPNLTPDLARGVINSDNGAASIYYDNFIYMSHASGAVRVDVAQARRQYGMGWVLPAPGVTNETPVIGPVTSWAFDQGWLMPAVYSRAVDTTYIGAGMPRRSAASQYAGLSAASSGVPDGPGPVLWHFAEAVVDGRVTDLRVTAPGGVPRLWIASVRGSSVSLAWQYLPDAVNPLASVAANAEFRFGNRLTMLSTPYDWGDPDAIKILRLIGLRADNLAEPDTEIVVAANAEGGAYTVQDTAVTSPRTRISPRAPLTQGHEIGIRLVGTGTDTAPPVIRALKLDAELQNEQFDRRYYPVSVGKGQDMRGGTKDQRNASDVWSRVADLHTIGVMEMRDNIQKATLNVRVHPLQQYTASEDSRVDGYSYVGTLPITVLEILPAETLSGNLWGGGSHWNDGSVWGSA